MFLFNLKLCEQLSRKKKNLKPNSDAGFEGFFTGFFVTFLVQNKTPSVMIEVSSNNQTDWGSCPQKGAVFSF